MRALQAPEKRKIGVHVTLDLETLGKLDALATRSGLTRSRLLREMIDELVERDAEARWLTESAAAELEEDTVPWEEVKQELGL